MDVKEKGWVPPRMECDLRFFVRFTPNCLPSSSDQSVYKNFMMLFESGRGRARARERGRWRGMGRGRGWSWVRIAGDGEFW